MKLNPSGKTKLFAILTIIMWASAFFSSHIALQSFSAPALGALRYALASVLLLIVGAVKKIGLPRLRDVPKFFMSGTMGFTLYMLFFNQGSLFLTSATSSVIISSGPIITAVLARVIFKEKLNALGWAAIGVSFAGILVLMLWDGIFSMNEGIFWMVGAAVAVSGYNLFQRSFSKRYTAFQATSYSMFAGTLLLMFFMPQAITEAQGVPLSHWLIVIYLGIFPSALAYLCWGVALSTAKRVSEVTNFMFLTPLLASLMGFAAIGEMPAVSTFVGGAIIIGGLLLFLRKDSLRKPALSEETLTLPDN